MRSAPHRGPHLIPATVSKKVRGTRISALSFYEDIFLVCRFAQLDRGGKVAVLMSGLCSSGQANGEWLRKGQGSKV